MLLPYNAYSIYIKIIFTQILKIKITKKCTILIKYSIKTEKGSHRSNKSFCVFCTVSESLVPRYKKEKKEKNLEIHSEWVEK